MTARADRTAFQKGFALIDLSRDPRKGEYWAFDIYPRKSWAENCKSAGEKVVPVEFRFASRKRGKK